MDWHQETHFLYKFTKLDSRLNFSERTSTSAKNDGNPAKGGERIAKGSSIFDAAMTH